VDEQAAKAFLPGTGDKDKVDYIAYINVGEVQAPRWIAYGVVKHKVTMAQLKWDHGNWNVVNLPSGIDIKVPKRFKTRRWARDLIEHGECPDD